MVVLTSAQAWFRNRVVKEMPNLTAVAESRAREWAKSIEGIDLVRRRSYSLVSARGQKPGQHV